MEGKIPEMDGASGERGVGLTAEPEGIASLADVFDALERLAAGDPGVRLNEAKGGPLGLRLRRAVNATAANLGEIVDFSHELAIGLAENFDVLQRVGQGDLSARIKGESRLELVEFLRDLTNQTIARLAGEIESHRADREELVRLATAVEQSAEGMVITDADGICRYVNPAFVQMTGFTRTDVIGRRLRDVESPDPRDPMYEEMMRTLRQGLVWRGRMRNRRRDGRLYEEDCTASPVVDEAGTVTRYVIIKRDVTLEEEMKRRLAQSQKLEALGTMAGGIAHELNNLLTPIIGFTELSMDDPSLSPPAQRNLEQVLVAAERAREIIWQILAFSRAEEKTRPSALDLAATLGESLELLRAAIPSSVALTLELERAGRSSYVSASPTQIQQILMNLALNAFAAMKNGMGAIRFALQAARPESLSPQLRADCDHFVEILVADDGCGIAPEDLERIFEPFFTTKPVGEGTGLGLAVVHGIVQELKGFLRVESRVGAGTTFHVILPRVELGELKAQGASAVSSSAGSERLLLVDDEAPVAEVFRRQLELLGYRVDMRTQPGDALAAFLQNPGAYDLVVSDNAMPGITGLLLAAEIHAARPDIPILICTGYGGDLSPDNLEEVGVVEILRKPISRDDLGRAVRRALDLRA